jgi:hypothetical protein
MECYHLKISTVIAPVYAEKYLRSHKSTCTGNRTTVKVLKPHNRNVKPISGSPHIVKSITSLEDWFASIVLHITISLSTGLQNAGDAQ